MTVRKVRNHPHHLGLVVDGPHPLVVVEAAGHPHLQAEGATPHPPLAVAAVAEEAVADGYPPLSQDHHPHHPHHLHPLVTMVEGTETETGTERRSLTVPLQK